MPFDTSDVVKKFHQSSDPYSKDKVKTKCPFKTEINAYLSSLVTKDCSSCMVLDAEKYLTTKELLKNPNVIHIDIANNDNDTVHKLKRKIKTHDIVSVHAMSDLDFFNKYTESYYDLIYLDRMGWWEKRVSKDAPRDVVECIIKNNQLNRGGHIAITMRLRGLSSKEIDTDISNCLTYMSQNGFTLVNEYKYSGSRVPMLTFVFKRK